VYDGAAAMGIWSWTLASGATALGSVKQGKALACKRGEGAEWASLLKGFAQKGRSRQYQVATGSPLS
jgi:hypothetical protein